MSEVAEAIEALKGSVEELGGCDLAGLEAKSLLKVAAALERLQTRVGAVGLGVLRELDDRVAWTHDGAHSLKHWLAAHVGTSRFDAGRRCNVAVKLPLMPQTSAALLDGSISFDHARLMAKCLQPRVRAEFTDEAEAMLLAAARELSADDFAKVVEAWLDRFDVDGPPPGEDTGRDAFRMARTFGGRWIGDIDLSDEAGRRLMEAIDAKAEEIYGRDQTNSEIDPTDPSAQASAANRRARALCELAEQGATAGETNSAATEPAFGVMVDAETFAGDGPDDPADAVREALDGTVLPKSAIDRLRCSCSAFRVMMDANGAVLDLGRTVRTASRAQRRAVTVRDRGCAVPGCDRPPNWCQVHHVEWWTDDEGPSDLDNLVMLCRHHHARIHQRHLEVRMVDGVPRFFNDWGQQLPVRRRATAA